MTQTHASRLILVVGLFLTLGLVSGCTKGGGGSDLPDGDRLTDGDDPVVNALTIHVAAPWPPYLYYSDDAGETFVDYPGLMMMNEGNGWYKAENLSKGPTGQLHFLFNNGAVSRAQAEWIRPYGRTDCLDCYFVTSADEVWILDGKVYTSRPDPSDGDAADGDASDGDAPDGDVTDGDASDGDAADGDASDGDAPDGDVTDGDATDGDATDGDVSDGDETDGDETDGDAIDGDETDGDDPDPTYTVHVYSDWTTAYLHHSFDGNLGEPSLWTELPGVAMSPEDGLWWRVSVQIPDPHHLAFVFTNGQEEWHRPFGCAGMGCYFETGEREVWVRNGLLYSSRPTYTAYTVHLYSGWAAPRLYYSVNADAPLHPLWVALPGLPMQGASRAAWWRATVEIESVYDLVFLFNDGNDDWHRPVGGGDFRTDASPVWVKDGVLYTSEPGR